MVTEVLKTESVNIKNKPDSKAAPQPEEQELQGIFSSINGSTFRIEEGGKRKPQTCDVFHGYLSDSGLPIGIIVDGCGNADPERIKQITVRIAKMVELVLEEIENSSSNKATIKGIVERHYRELDNKLLEERGEDAVLFATTIIYQNAQGELQALSFGTGDTLIALKKQDATIQTVVKAKNIYDDRGHEMSPLSLPSPEDVPVINQDFIINQLGINVISIQPEDRFLFFTDGAHDFLSTEIETISGPTHKTSRIEMTTEIREKSLTQHNPALTESVGSIYEKVGKNAEEKFKDKLKNKPIDEKEKVYAGDDTTIAEMIIPSPEKQEALYQKALSQVNKTIHKNQNSQFAPQAQKLVSMVESTRTVEPKQLPTLTAVLNKTNYLLQNPTDSNALQQYREFANRVSGAPSPRMKKLGAGMAAFGISLLILGIFATVFSAGLGSPLLILSLVINAKISAGLTTGAVAVTGSGAGLFREGGQRRGVSATMQDVADVTEKPEPDISHQTHSI